MSVHNKVQTQVTKTVRNVRLLHGHRHEVVNATGRSLLQTVPLVNQTLLQIINVSHLRPMNTVLHRTPHLVGNRVQVGAVVRSQIWSNESLNLLLQ